MTFLGLHLTSTLLDLLLLNALLAYSAFPVFSIGRMNLSFIAFSGLGGYTAALLVAKHGWSPALGTIGGILLSAAIAVPLAFMLGRVRGVYLAIVTINLAACFQVLIYNVGFMGGANGITGLPVKVDSLVLACALAVVILAFWLLARTKRGAGIRLQRNDELLALSTGVNTTANVAFLFVASAAIGALQGAMTAFWYGFVSPDTYSFSGVILAVAMVVLGGSGEWSGPFVGAIFFTVLPEWLRPFGVWRDVVTGVILLCVVYFFPEGIVGELTSRLGFRRARTSREALLRAAQQPS